MTNIFDGMAAIFVDTFAEDDLIPYTRGGTTVSVKGIFDDPASLVDIGDGGNVVRMPRLHCAVADLPAGHGQGDTLVIDRTNYVVRAALPDGHGMVSLDLERLA